MDFTLDQNVYEGSAWSSLIELTSKSVNNDGHPQNFQTLQEEIG